MMKTQNLHIDDGYLKDNEALVIATKSDDYGHWFATDSSCFYAMSGGQPGDSGVVINEHSEWHIKNTVADESKVWHLIDEDQMPLAKGDVVQLVIDWQRRYAHMRMHSALHMLCASVPAGVTSGSIGAAKGRLDFDLIEPIDKLELEQKINDLIAGNHAMTTQWISKGEFEHEINQNPELVRTVNVAPPVTDERGVRLVLFGDVDRQPCGGTHVNNTREIGRVRVGKVEKKGKNNRRINIHFDD